MRALRAAMWAGSVLVLSLCASTPAQANGALAIGACGAYGYARGYANPAQAEAAALAKCSGKHCKVVASVRGSCMAFAVELSNPCGPYGYATGPTLARAQNRALRECQRSGGTDCVIRTYACD